MTYNKRQKAHWNDGKSNKGMRKAKENEYAKREIQEQLDVQDENYRVKQYKRTRNHKASLEYRITWYETVLKTRKDYSDRLISSFRSTLEKLKNQLKGINENKDN